MRVLLVGGGGREHALAWKLSRSERLTKLYVAPGNAGTRAVAENVAINPMDFEALADFVASRRVEMLVVGPEEPLVRGIRDFFEADGRFGSLLIVGPGSAGARLEGSKDFAKGFMARHGIPTAAHLTVTRENEEEGLAFLQSLRPPYVLKADGLAAGKGVLIVNDLEEARRELGEMLRGKFGDAGERVVLEEFARGIELSVFALTDGRSYKMLGSAKDYKRVGDGDTGPNTGGMGAVSPVPFADEAFERLVEERVVRPTVEGLRAEGIDYRGFLFFGLMNVDGEPLVIEYNARLGDPETEVVIPRLRVDLLPLLEAMATGRLREVECRLDARFRVAVAMVGGGYPGSSRRGLEISGLEAVTGGLVFHAGTAMEDDRVVTNGGRVVVVGGRGETLAEAARVAYAAVGEIHFEGMHFRKDIGADLEGY